MNQLENPRILHLDDDPFFLETFEKAMGTIGLETESFWDPVKFEARLPDIRRHDLIVLDIHLGSDESLGVSLAQKVRHNSPHALLLMCSDLHDSKTVARCLKLGADDYIFKGIDEEDLPQRILDIISQHQQTLAKGPGQTKASPQKFSGKFIEGVTQRIPKIIDSALTAVHIFGESGTGKEVVATLFEKTLSSGTPFAKIHCGAIAPSLLESELFGHMKGAFTGANTNKVGLIEQANGGWIFLDEVATLSPQAQVALLRVLENGSLRRVGAPKEIKVSVRVISATNESIPDLVAQGKFRQDLWQRLCESQITLPPLRERMGEFEDHAHHFCREMQGGPYQISQGAIRMLQQYNWANGNIRELRNCLRAMTEKAIGKTLTPATIPGHIWTFIDQAVEEDPDYDAQSGGNRNRVVIQWDSKNLPSFEDLADQLLLRILNLVVQEQGKLTLREFSKISQIPRSSLSRRLHQILEKKLIEPSQLKKLVAIRPKEDHSHDIS